MNERLLSIAERVMENRRNGLPSYEGLNSYQVAEYNSYLMFGENDEAFPDEWEWSSIVD